jgi:predicted  nucleic acid-binding Zn-ribbon protein
MANDSNSFNYKSIKDKLLKVKAKQDSLNQENLMLQERSSSLSRELGDLKVKYQELKKENERLRLAKTIVGKVSDKAEMKYKVNEMVREIDKCIALLNR